jgi:hypothetical protein
MDFGSQGCFCKLPALLGRWLHAACIGLVCLFALLSFPPPAMAGVVIAGDPDNLDVRVTGASGKDMIAHLVATLGIPIRYQSIGDNVINDSRRGSLLHVLSEFFPQNVIVVRRVDGRVLEATITKLGDYQSAILAQPTTEEIQKATDAFIPPGFVKR